MDGGTLFQLRNIINRRNVIKDPSKNVSACEEFFFLVTEAHILTAAMAVFQMESLEDTPKSPHFTATFSESTNTEQRSKFLLAVGEVIQFVDLKFCQQLQPVPDDSIQAYACEVLSLGLLLREFDDSVREGDGTRIIRCWRYFLLLFKANHRHKYAIEAFTLLLQFDFLLPHRLARQLAWSRTVNIHGRAGKNVSCDLNMEHLNREAKKQLSGLGSNITDAAVTRIGNSLGEVVQVLHQFDAVSGVKQDSGRHSKRSNSKDIGIVLKQLQEKSKLFIKVSGRNHRIFPNFKQNRMNSLQLDMLTDWMRDQLSNKIKYN